LPCSRDINSANASRFSSINSPQRFTRAPRSFVVNARQAGYARSAAAIACAVSAAPPFATWTINSPVAGLETGYVSAPAYHSPLM
jgi:hypothetical protein